MLPLVGFQLAFLSYFGQWHSKLVQRIAFDCIFRLFAPNLSLDQMPESDNLLASSEHVNLSWAIELMKSYFKISENKFDQLEMNVQGTRLILLTHLFSFKESLIRECDLRFHIEIL